MAASTLLNDIELVPELEDWNGGKSTDLAAWISCGGNFKHALGYASLSGPTFREYGGSVHRADGFTIENYDKWLDKGRRNLKAVQSATNHVHVVDPFPNV